MFTGIIQDIGTIAVIEKAGDWVITIAASPALLGSLSLGASVACSGVCLTVIRFTDEDFTVQASGETLSKTTLGAWQVGTKINLERALRMGDELGGHMVSGHVDGIARVVSLTPEGDSLRFQFEIPAEFLSFLAPKGSITLDGISLTVNEVDGNIFGVNIIPHTQTATTLGEKKVVDTLNFEIDLIARYVGRMLDQRGRA
ncbi:MAG TPA: riboflavin synthase [Rhodospirillaceae bacterium]|nr:riboflavin synthase [Rhodospirillaceae bacterium]